MSGAEHGHSHHGAHTHDHGSELSENQLRVRALESILVEKGYVDPAALDAGGRVVFGATVELEDEDSGDAVTYQIVGEDEADLKLGLINVSSPIARALIGKEEGDVAEVQAPGGVRRYEIVAVSYR